MKKTLTFLSIIFLLSSCDDGQSAGGEEFGDDGLPVQHHKKKAAVQTSITIDTTTMDSATRAFYNQQYH